MGLHVDFSRLDPQDVLDLAIHVEEEARDNYEQLSTWMDADGNSDAAEFFRRMAGLEQLHRDQLASQRAKLFGDAPERHSADAPWEVEQPDYDAIGRQVPLGDAIRHAIEAEQRAHDYYEGALEYASNPSVIELFNQLKDSELEHVRMLREQLERL